MNHSEKSVIDRLVQFIEQNLDTPTLSLDTICKEIGLSRTQLHRIVTEQTQLSTTLFIRKIKLEKAQSLLSNLTLRISEVGDSVGISNPQNFSKYFTETFGVTPTEYRKQLQKASQATAHEPRGASMAVLPFVNMSSDPEQEYFSDGITEELISRLALIPELKVASRTSSFTFKGVNQDLRQTGRQLNVAYILEGSIRKSGNKIRITAQLNEVASGFYLWSERFDRDLQDIFDIQDEISLAILKAIKVTLLGTDKDALLKRYTNNPQAYQLYLQGRFYQNKFAGADTFHKAIDYYKAALDIEPNYAIAYAGMASCYLYLWFYRHLSPNVSLPKLKAAAEHSLRLDDEIAESYLAIARVKLFYEWDFEGAKNAFQKTIELNHSLAEAYQQYALYQGIVGNHIQAQVYAQTSLDLDPISLISHYYLGYNHWLVGDFERAIAQGKKLVDMEPNFWGGHSIVGLNLIKLQQYQEALPSLQKALQLNYGGQTLSSLGVLYGFMDNAPQAHQILNELSQLNQKQPVAHYDFGIVHAVLGDIERAISYFEQAIAHHEPPMLFFRYIVRDWLPDFQQDARYQHLQKQINIPVV
ncbi:MAG: helix-turn-helix domain-containing protein [Spirosomaceae bacterium]|jgi:serine/threonine-protein kinase|nr:helix-turn-helix domain-containing protein [Spirosomataceae bacterium]